MGDPDACTDEKQPARLHKFLSCSGCEYLSYNRSVWRTGRSDRQSVGRSGEGFFPSLLGCTCLTHRPHVRPSVRLTEYTIYTCIYVYIIFMNIFVYVYMIYIYIYVYDIYIYVYMIYIEPRGARKGPAHECPRAHKGPLYPASYAVPCGVPWGTLALFSLHSQMARGHMYI